MTSTVEARHVTAGQHVEVDTVTPDGQPITYRGTVLETRTFGQYRSTNVTRLTIATAEHGTVESVRRASTPVRVTA